MDSADIDAKISIKENPNIIIALEHKLLVTMEFKICLEVRRKLAVV